MVLPPWPKGPFPARYTARAVLARLDGAWADDPRRDGLERVRALALEAHPAHRDPIVVVLVGDADLASVRAALASAPITAFRWRPGRCDDRMRANVTPTCVGFCPSADPIDALVGVGVASPQHGIGTTALVRFVTTLKGLAHGVSIDELGEDALGLTLIPKSGVAALRIAARARELCAPLAARADDATLGRTIEGTHTLALSWP